MRYEYRVVPAPTKGIKAKGLKTAEARFAQALQEVINQQSAEGWEYHRTETLPSTERAGLTSTTTVWRNLLVFKRCKDAEQATPGHSAHVSAPSSAVPSEAVDVTRADATMSEVATEERPTEPLATTNDDATDPRR